MTDHELFTQISVAIKTLREKKKLTWQQAADQSGLNRCHYRRIENGKSINIRTLNKLLNFHGISLKEFAEKIK